MRSNLMGTKDVSLFGASALEHVLRLLVYEPFADGRLPKRITW
jgi:hypothetical protein